MKRKRNSILIFALLLAVVITGSVVAGTYARYTSQIDAGETSGAPVAKWVFSDENSNPTLTFNLANTYDPTTLSEGKIAPGTEGSFSVDVYNNYSEVGVDYAVSLWASYSTVPTNLKFYLDENFTDEICFAPVGSDGTIAATGTLAPGASDNITFYWKWEYYTSDDNDQMDTGDVDSITFNGGNMSFEVDITGTQVIPQ